MSEVHVVPFSEELAAEIQGVDLTRPIDNVTMRMIVDALHKYGVIRLRGPFMPDINFVNFSKRFGNSKYSVSEFVDKVHPELVIVSNIAVNGKNIGLKDAARKWHSDLSYTKAPNPISILYAHEVCKQGGGTQFVTMYRAWDTLPDHLRKRLEGLYAEHSIENYGFTDKEGMPAEDRKKFPPVIHPVVVEHPVTGRKALYVSEGSTTRILGMPEEESRQLLDFLFEHSVRQEGVWTQIWQVGDILVWDNRCTMHRQTDYDPMERRMMKRATIMEVFPGI
jgi:taurine dioxygenase